jgi:Fe2+ or Zn2+ uptake regulation protein
MQQLFMEKITLRQQEILNFIRIKERTSNKDILEHISLKFGDVTRFTIIRDLDFLINMGLVKKVGSGRSVSYEEIVSSRLLTYIDVESYFESPPDVRVTKESFDFLVYDEVGDIFTEEELAGLNSLTKDYQKRYDNLSPAALKREFERLTIEFSWKSSRIEGNTYNLVETEYLIKEDREAEGHSKEEAIMILNHKTALDHIRDNLDNFKEASVRNIENAHRLLIDRLGVRHNIRKGLVGITGTKYKPLENEFQIREALTAMCALVNEKKDAFSKSLLINAFISYIQAFEDGNKRTSRMMGNAMLMAHGACPLSFRSIDETEYKKAMLLFYEQNNLRYFKELFIEQYEFAARTYFL